MLIMLKGDLPNVPQSSMPSDDVTSKPAEQSFDLKSPHVKADDEQNKATESTPIFTAADKTPAEIDTKPVGPVPTEQTTTQDMQEAVQDYSIEKSSSLLDDYYLRDKSEESVTSSSKKLKDISSSMDDLHDGFITKDGKLVLDFLQAIHAAEERQAELDAHFFAEEKRAMKEKYEKELKDARVRELMYAEREAILDKELNKERVKAAAALKSLQEKLEEKLKTELEQKEMEVEQKLKQMQDISKAELTAAIAREKASQIEKMAEANLHINALCMAFYARSEEARQTHSVHKLALKFPSLANLDMILLSLRVNLMVFLSNQGALALEDALGKGLPIKKEIEALHTHVEGIDDDSLIPLVLSSLPDETQKYGTDTVAQLNHKASYSYPHLSVKRRGKAGYMNSVFLGYEFDGNGKGDSEALQPNSPRRWWDIDTFIGSCCFLVEGGRSVSDGIESIINRVESLLAQGKLCEAADTLENGVKGSQAAEVVDDWVKRARNRAITEQALTILQSVSDAIQAVLSPCCYTAVFDCDGRCADVWRSIL
ncbi:hypothetical protein Sango_1912200 [Sesamum angolense]|uniref:Uncharacterized protein n=1 Tax=Sesamum angolense TaxID=2727404 RepID=A0AAE2BQV1_9LAMI|nr:hypothetical protein Sango_1912200 [Sesamum angolense]